MTLYSDQGEIKREELANLALIGQRRPPGGRKLDLGAIKFQNVVKIAVFRLFLPHMGMGNAVYRSR